MSDPRTGEQIAAEYGLGDMVPFTEEHFPMGAYAVGGTGSVVRSVFWAVEIRDDVQADVCHVLRWQPGWDITDIVEQDSMNGSIYAITPTTFGAVAGPGGSFNSTGGDAWLLTSEKLDELLTRADDDDEESDAPPAQEPIVVPEVTFAGEDDAPDDGETPTPQDSNDDNEPEEIDEPELEQDGTGEAEADDDGVTPDEPEVEVVIGSGLRTGPMPAPKGRISRVYALYTLVNRFGPVKWSVLEAWAWEEKLFGKAAQATMREKLNETIVEITKAGWDLRVANEHLPTECVHVGPLEEQTSASDASTWGQVSDYMEALLVDIWEGVVGLARGSSDDTIGVTLSVEIGGDSMTKST